MSSFFRGWRRKIGVVTLLMACVFMAGWTRSMVADDIAYVRTSELHYEFVCSRRHGLLLMHDQIAQPVYAMKVEFGPVSLATTPSQMRFPEVVWDSFSPYRIVFDSHPLPLTQSGFWAVHSLLAGCYSADSAVSVAASQQITSGEVPANTRPRRACGSWGELFNGWRKKIGVATLLDFVFRDRSVDEKCFQRR